MPTGKMYRVWIDLPRLEERLRDPERGPGTPPPSAESWLRSQGFVKSFEGTDWLAGESVLAKLQPDELIYRKMLRGALDDAGDEQASDGVGKAAPCDVLLVEDDAGTRYAMERALTTRGMRAVSASGYQQAVSLLSLKPRWLVVDLRLPDGDGEEILRHVQENQLGMRVIVVTAYTDRAHQIKAMKPHAVFVKPFDPAVLVNAVSAA